MTLYSDEVKRIVRSYEWPKELFLDVQDGWDDLTDSPFLWIVLYRDNFVELDGVDVVKTSKLMNDLLPRLITMGVPSRLVVKPGNRPNG